MGNVCCGHSTDTTSNVHYSGYALSAPYTRRTRNALTHVKCTPRLGAHIPPPTPTANPLSELQQRTETARRRQRELSVAPVTLMGFSAQQQLPNFGTGLFEAERSSYNSSELVSVAPLATISPDAFGNM